MNETPTFESLLTDVLSAAYRTAYHLARNEADAEELVQEAALLAFRGFHRFQPGTNFRAWFLTILRNRFISLYRKQQRQVPTVDLEDAPDLYLYAKQDGLSDPAEEPVRQAIARLDVGQVSDALSELPEDFRDAAILYFTQDLSYREIAEVLNIPVGTVRSRLHRGRKLLQHKLWNLAREYGIIPSEASSEERT